MNKLDVQKKKIKSLRPEKKEVVRMTYCQRFKKIYRVVDAATAEQLDKITVDARKQLKDSTLKAVRLINPGKPLPRLKGKKKLIL